MLRFRLLARGVVAASLVLGGLSTPAHAADPVVAAAGDIACDPTSLSFNNGNGTSTKCRQKYTSNLLVDQNLAAVLALGDNQYEFGTLEQFQLSYDLSWGRVKSITRPAVGNHEYDLLAGDGYFDYFNGVGNYTGTAGDRDKGYYSFDVGDWHLIALNSMCIKIDGCETGSPQEQWLRADLAANAGTSCTLAYWHHPLFSSGTEGTDEDSNTTGLWQALYEAGAEVVLNGHEHLYERFAPQTALGVADPEHGLREFIVGTGGKSFHDIGTVASNSQLRDNTHFGVIKLVLHQSSYSWSFVTETGAVRDSGSSTCHDAPDHTPPETSLNSGPQGLTKEREANFSFASSEDGSSFECTLDGPGGATGSTSPCTSPRTYADLADGAYTFRVKARDAAGNEDASPATRSFTVDGTAPDTSISNGPSGTTNTTSATFTFAASEGGATLECSLDGAVFASCTSPKTYANLADGSHTFKTRATDTAGNTDPSPATRTFTIDATAPETSLSSGPQGLTNDRDASFSFASSESGSSFQCELDGPGATQGSTSACTSPKAFTGLTDGTYTFTVKGRDTAGNEDSSPATRSFTVDGTAPDTSISSGPSGTTNTTSATFTFAASENLSTLECSLDGAAFASCTSPKTYANLDDGSHTFKTRATDTAGNTDSSPATRTFTIDATAPNTSITNGPSGTTNTTSATFTFGASEGGSTLECSLDGAAFASCTSPKTYANLDDGSHTFATRATDAVGNTDSSPATRTFTVDDLAPDTSISDGPSGTINTTSATFTFGASEGGASLECSLDGAAFADCTSPMTYDNLADGSHTFATRAADAAGNTDGSPAARTFTVDSSAPETSISDGPSGTISVTSAAFTFDASEAGSAFECSLDGAAWDDCVSAASYAGLAKGSHTFETRATDAAGNTDLSPAARTFTVKLPVVPDPVEPTPDPVDPPTTLPDPVEDLDSLKHYRVAEREIVSGRAYRRSGSKRRLYVDDGDRLEIAAEQRRADVFVSEFQASMAIGTDVRDSLGSLTLSYNGGTSARTGSVTVYAFNYRTDRWVKAFAHTGRLDRSLEWSASAFALDYVSPEGTFSIRVKGKRAKAFRTRTDLLELTVES